MTPMTTLIVRMVVETCSGMVISRALQPIVKSASGLTKAALCIGVLGLSTAGGAVAGKAIINSINEGLEVGDEILEKTED